ncbi:hypothetical protein A0H81_08061 [Grifola frondosa]|uniref:Uncharacterized protein n=1 Tax=Grifola frondosa TaxID=5627 RepID=A0A1C7M8E8_GRIFR|nr:hypothetical protein A0H81_08061 [Grifola frondosa]
MGEYLWLMEKYSDKVRYLPNVSELYASATEEWTMLGLAKPSRAEAARRGEYFKVCDAMCKGNPSIPLQCVLAVFAAWGALQLISDHDTFYLSEDDQCAIRKAANEYMMERINSKEPDRNLLPPHIQNVIYLDENQDAGPKIELGQPFN